MAMTGERIYTFFLFGAAVCLFGTLISQLNDIFINSQRFSQELNLHLDSYVCFMREYGVPMGLELKIRKWVRFQFNSERKEYKKNEVLSDPSMPEHYRVQLARSLQRDLFVWMPFFNDSEDRNDVKAAFCAELLLKSHMLYFPARSVIVDSRQDADSLMIIASGHVEVHLPLSSTSQQEGARRGATRLRIFKRGDVFGDTAILGDRRWAGAYGIDADFIAGEHCSIARIHKTHIQGILRQFEFWPIKRRLDRAKHNLLENMESEDARDDQPQSLRFLMRIPFLNKLEGRTKEAFCSELLVRVEMQSFPVGSVVADSREIANGLVVVASGSVSVYIPAPAGRCGPGGLPNYGTLIKTFKRGDVFGDTSILGDHRWAGAYGIDADFIAGEHCSIARIGNSHIQVVLDRPEFRQIRCRIQRARKLFVSLFDSRGENSIVHAPDKCSQGSRKYTNSSPIASGSGPGRRKSVGHKNGSSLHCCLPPAETNLKTSFLFIFFARRLLQGSSPSSATVFHWILLARYLMRIASKLGRARKQCAFKIVLLGDAAVGKSSLITRFVDGTFAKSSIWNAGVELRMINVADESLRLQLWNTTGQERFRSIAPSFYSGADGLVVVYDITSHKSLHSIRRWMEDACRKTRTTLPVIFIGNKSDLSKQRAVMLSEALEMAGEYKATVHEVSARTGGGVEDAFHSLAASLRTLRDQAMAADTKEKRIKRRRSSVFGF
uniref:Cyclic nucleotide-binding domain-containing protein n=1 Tax=Cryptomonas curvata TaxID=233186 RepID=A0A7S0MJ71_9CRYP|mmetsp:Transcript_4266/g.9471  ORF Transcript_4266/g.9471 Transcript_4266/m.9471 type:complete len:721 (+) Transcript_4266:71-2233(+)|eukprot:CAMPEP_0172204346 /NCGR_PEP_ID=MMETSP1050-20130122/31888_1 /TAXON_ID=233186 /ORGANISM="Cryptomonas curvata, Strain CCAP979/52" /LENGTH=720 /DNA_ID=CAMNT_0012882861 /DNA_START=807 /DNA_END=2969 /DNA_ORIENTATION=-